MNAYLTGLHQTAQYTMVIVLIPALEAVRAPPLLSVTTVSRTPTVTITDTVSAMKTIVDPLVPITLVDAMNAVTAALGQLATTAYLLSPTELLVTGIIAVRVKSTMVETAAHTTPVHVPDHANSAQAHLPHIATNVTNTPTGTVVRVSAMSTGPVTNVTPSTTTSVTIVVKAAQDHRTATVLSVLITLTVTTLELVDASTIGMENTARTMSVCAIGDA